MHGVLWQIHGQIRASIRATKASDMAIGMAAHIQLQYMYVYSRTIVWDRRGKGAESASRVDLAYWRMQLQSRAQCASSQSRDVGPVCKLFLCQFGQWISVLYNFDKFQIQYGRNGRSRSSISMTARFGPGNTLRIY